MAERLEGVPRPPSLRRTFHRPPSLRRTDHDPGKGIYPLPYPAVDNPPVASVSIIGECHLCNTNHENNASR